MKKILLISALLLCVTGATGQQHHHHGTPAPREVRHHDNRGHDRHRHEVRPHDIHHHDVHHLPGVRADVFCVRDWQELWNGCYVRVNQFGVSVLDRRDRRIVRGEEVILLPTGDYLVKSGHFWRVYTAYGDRLTHVWGDIVELMPDGLFRCIRSGNVHWYDLAGREQRFHRL